MTKLYKRLYEITLSEPIIDPDNYKVPPLISRLPIKDANYNTTNEAKQVIITTGKTQGDVVEILEGVKAGDQIVMEGARSVQNGQQVQILN